MANTLTKEAYLEGIKSHKFYGDAILPGFEDDFDIVMWKFRRANGSSMKNASNRLKNDESMGLKAARYCCSALEYMSLTLLNNRDFALKAVELNGNALAYLKLFQNDLDVVRIATSKDGSVLKHASKELRANEDFVKSVLDKNVNGLNDVDTKFFNDREFMLRYIGKYGYCLSVCSPRLQNDPEIVIAALTQNCMAIKYVGPRLKRNIDVFRAAVVSFLASPDRRSKYEKNPWDFFDWKAILNTRDRIREFIRLDSLAFLMLREKVEDDLDLKYEAAYAHPDLSDRVKYDKGVYLLNTYRTFIKDEDWPVIKRAMLNNIEDLINPPDVVKSLATGVDTLRLYADYALSKLQKIKPVEMPEFDT